VRVIKERKRTHIHPSRWRDEMERGSPSQKETVVAQRRDVVGCKHIRKLELWAVLRMDVRERPEHDAQE
jgi:hypothetical protein